MRKSNQVLGQSGIELRISATNTVNMCVAISSPSECIRGGRVWYAPSGRSSLERRLIYDDGHQWIVVERIRSEKLHDRASITDPSDFTDCKVPTFM
jgi:hypothetical protein